MMNAIVAPSDTSYEGQFMILNVFIWYVIQWIDWIDVDIFLFWRKKFYKYYFLFAGEEDEEGGEEEDGEEEEDDE